jgi:outer membrane protein TolC
VIFKSTPQQVLRTLVLTLAATPWALSAQTVAPPAPQDWRSANDAVGSLKRGHIDVLKWEAANTPQDLAAPAPIHATIPLLTLDDVIRQAWRAHLDLRPPLAALGADNVSLIAAGSWTALDPSLQRRVDGAGEVLEVATQAKKAWLQAVAARQSLAPYRAALNAIDAATELGQRMVQVGNWSKLKLAPLELAQSAAKMSWLRAQYAAKQAQANLINTLRLKGQYAAVALPARLPDVPLHTIADTEWQAQALRTQGQLLSADSQRNRSNTSMALAAYQTSHGLYLASRDVLKVRDYINEETVLHYNGMLSSVWDLLGEARNQSQAVIDLINAQRDFWLAEGDLQWVIQGGEPDRFISLGGGDEAAAPAGH